MEDRLSFIYLEHCTLGRDGNALTATDDQGVIHIPSAALGALLLGPGTRITHQAVTVAAESGLALVWVGEEGVRFYAGGRPLARTTRLLERQAQLVSKKTSRLSVARAMYEMRFPDEDVSTLTMHQLRGREGARVRSVYRKWSELSGVDWSKRSYKTDDFQSSDLINQALTSAHQCLYGLTHACVVALGCSPGLGFVHTGHDRSFIYDVADLYKTETSIPVAFQVVSKIQSEELHDADVSTLTRHAMRDVFKEEHLTTKCVSDIRTLLLPDESEDETWADVIGLWDGNRVVSGGVNYGKDELW